MDKTDLSLLITLLGLLANLGLGPVALLVALIGFFVGRATR
jgi:hypothetical protein